jgi:phenol 2-monooxygenase (NADPH)
MLDQLGLLDDLLQIGYIAHSSVTYKDGKRVTERGWNAIYENMHNTNMNYVLNIRQKYSEQVFRNAYERLGDHVHKGWILKRLSYEDTPQGVRVKSIIEELASGTEKAIIR